MPTQLSLTYYPWITQEISGEPLRLAIDNFRGLLETALRHGMGNDVTLKLLPEMQVPEQLADIKKKPEDDGLVCRIGLLNPIGYAMTHGAVPDVQSVAVIRRKIPGVQDTAGPTYKAQLYVRANSPIKTVQDMRKHSMGFGSRQSTSNFLVPATMLWEQGIHPLNGFSRVEFTGGHDFAARAVYQSKVDIGAGHDGVIVNLAATPGFSDAAEVLRTVQWSEDIPSDPVAVHVAATADAKKIAKQVADALIKVANPDDGDGSVGNLAVKAFWGTTKGFQTISPDAYNGLLRVMYPIGLRPADML
jgi:phosphate/phosphite/phosphonate ABC transporter binding protein